MSIQARQAPTNPALIRHAEERAQSIQNRIADTITRFAGSMQFVYIHEELLRLSDQILELTRAIHALTETAEHAPRAETQGA